MERKKDLKNHRKKNSENSHAIINKEISSTENLENQDMSNKTYGTGDILLYDGGLPRREQGQDHSDDEKLGLELTPDEQSERVNLFLLGFASIILMNAMAVLITVFANSKYDNQLIIKSSNTKRQMKGNLVCYDSHICIFKDKGMGLLQSPILKRVFFMESKSCSLILI